MIEKRKWLVMKKCLILFNSLIILFYFISCKSSSNNKNNSLVSYIYDSLKVVDKNTQNINIIIANPKSSCLFCFKKIFNLLDHLDKNTLVITDIKNKKLFAPLSNNVFADTSENLFSLLPIPSNENKLLIIKNGKIQKIYSIYSNNVDSLNTYLLSN